MQDVPNLGGDTRIPPSPHDTCYFAELVVLGQTVSKRQIVKLPLFLSQPELIKGTAYAWFLLQICFADNTEILTLPRIRTFINPVSLI